MPTKRRNKKKGVRSHQELLDSIARSGRTVKGGSLKHQTKSQRSKAPYKKDSPSKHAVSAAFAKAEREAMGSMPLARLGKKKKGGKSLLSRAYSAVDRSVFGGALPGGAKRGMDKLVDETSAASKDAKKKKKRRRRSKPIHKR